MTAQAIRVLLVDDHAVVRNGVRLMLSTASEIELSGEAENAKAALDLLQKQDFDVALIDIALPDRNGLQLLKLVHAQRPALAVVMFSMYAEELYAIRALRQGASGYLTKDSPAASLVAAVRRVHSGGTYVSPAVVNKLATEVSSSRSRTHGHESLSDRELEVLKQIAAGKSLSTIAAEMHLSPNTVATYRARICTKLDVSSTAELTRYAIENLLAH